MIRLLRSMAAFIVLLSHLVVSTTAFAQLWADQRSLPNFRMPVSSGAMDKKDAEPKKQMTPEEAEKAFMQSIAHLPVEEQEAKKEQRKQILEMAKAMTEQEKKYQELVPDHLKAIFVKTKELAEKVIKDDAKNQHWREEKESSASTSFKRITPLIDHEVPETQKEFETKKWVDALKVRTRDTFQQTQVALFDESLSAEVKKALLYAFLNQVYFPLRSVAINMGNRWPDADKFFDAIMPQFPADLIQKEDQFLMGDLSSKAAQFEDLSGYGQACVKQARLSFNPLLRLGADIEQLKNGVQHAVEKNNIVRGMQMLTVASLIEQQQIYNQVLGDHSTVEIPDSCKKISSFMPGVVRAPKLAEEEREALIENMLKGTGVGLQDPERSAGAMDLKYIPPRPGVERRFTPYTEFEIAVASNRAKEVLLKERAAPKPAIDDSGMFSDVMKLKQEKLDKVGQKAARPFSIYTQNEADVKKRQEHAEALVTKITTLARLPGSVQPQSVYLLELMDKKNTERWQDVVPEAIKEDLKKSWVTLNIPPPESPDSYRRYALQQLAMYVKTAKNQVKSISEKSELSKTTADMSFLSRHSAGCKKNSIQNAPTGIKCDEGIGDRSLGAYYDYLDKQLEKFLDVNKFIPPTEYMTPEFRDLYVSRLMPLWQSLTGSGDFLAKKGFSVPRNNIEEAEKFSYLPRTVFSEWDMMHSEYLSSPITSLRLAYLMEKHENDKMVALTPLGLDVYSVMDERERLQHKTTELTLKGLAKELGLDTPVEPRHFDRVLHKKEVDAVWAGILEQRNNANYGLLKSKVGFGNDQGKTHYELLEEIEVKQPVSRGETLALAARYQIPKQIIEPQIDSLVKSELAEKAELLAKLKKASGNDAEQTKIFEEYKERFGFEHDDGAKDASEKIGKVSTLMKKPLQRQIILRAASESRSRSRKLMEEICSGDTKDLNVFKEKYRETISKHQELLQKLGLKEMPKEVQDELTRMSKEDWNDMGSAGLAIALMIGAYAVPAACIAMTDGACTPFAGFIKGGMMLGATYYSGLVMIPPHMKAYWEAQERVAKVKEFEVAGYTNAQGVKDQKKDANYHLTWGVGVNFLFGFQMLGVTAKSVGVGGRAAANKLIKGALAEGGGKSAAMQQAERQYSIIEAKNYLLKAPKILNGDLNPKHLVDNFVDDWGEAFTKTVVVNESPDVINKASATHIAEAFGHNPAKLEKFLENAAAKIEKRAIGRFEGMINRGESAQRLEALRKEAQQKATKLVADMRAELSHLKDIGDKAKIEQFIEKNIDDFTDVFLDMRKRFFIDSAAEFIIEGNQFYDNLWWTLRKIAAHRDVLMFEAGRREAQLVFKLDPGVKLHSTYQVMRRFMDIAKEQNGGGWVHDYQEDLLKKIRTNPKSQHVLRDMSNNQLRKTLFNPQDAKEMGKADELWNSLPSEILFGSEELNQNAFRIVKALSNYSNNKDQFDDFWTAARVMGMTNRKNPAEGKLPY